MSTSAKTKRRGRLLWATAGDGDFRWAVRGCAMRSVSRESARVHSALALILLAGCASPGLSPVKYSVRQVPRCSPPEVFDASKAALRGLGYTLDTQDREAGVLTTHPVALASVGEVDTRRLRLGAGESQQRIAEVRVGQRGEAVNVYCKVVIQRQTTEAHRLLGRDYGSSDIPGQTPIDCEAATTKEQNTVWQTIRRDTTTERRILAAILEQFGKVERDEGGRSNG